MWRVTWGRLMGDPPIRDECPVESSPLWGLALVLGEIAERLAREGDDVGGGGSTESGIEAGDCGEVPAA